MTELRHRAQVHALKREGYLAYLTLEVENNFRFRAGQHTVLYLKTEERDIPFYYSIASSPGILPHIEFLIGCRDGDLRTHGLIEHLSLNKEIEITPAMGSFILPDLLPERLLFISAGTGISPLRAMMITLLHNHTGHHINLVQGAGLVCDLPYHEAFSALEKKHPYFHYHPIVSKETWQGPQGRVHELYPGLISPANTAAFICGPKEMVEETREKLVGLGLDVQQIFKEKH
ncbi:MAG: hypothetical protein H6585_01120 [Flavobacteriales bacterium]|nr:hypothetical protein [Flavobacteriales bacterium]MCB9446928.1 hypothetical protein [Flavobacteriales bacterium]